MKKPAARPAAWREQKQKLMDKFPQLTAEDLVFTRGNKEEMFSNLRDKLGKTRQEFEELLRAL